AALALAIQVAEALELALGLRERLLSAVPAVPEAQAAPVRLRDRQIDGGEAQALSAQALPEVRQALLEDAPGLLVGGLDPEAHVAPVGDDAQAELPEAVRLESD